MIEHSHPIKYLQGERHFDHGDQLMPMMIQMTQSKICGNRWHKFEIFDWTMDA